MTKALNDPKNKVPYSLYFAVLKGLVAIIRGVAFSLA